VQKDIKKIQTSEIVKKHVLEANMLLSIQMDHKVVLVKIAQQIALTAHMIS